MTFPKGFLWGAATSSYQIEGAALEDGRGECIWHRFSHTPGNVANGDTGEVAADHYHRYRDDIALMREFRLQAYRFSISWARVIPEGTGASNAAGFDFYDRLVDSLLEAGIRPFATLYHWDLPQILQDRGGWANPDVVNWFVEYSDRVTQRLGDRVKDWVTHNEPWIIAFLGHFVGVHAPGIHDLPSACRAAHHIMLSHGAAVPIIRRNVPDAQLGLVLNLNAVYPASDKPEDIAAAQFYDGFANRLFLDATFKGCYPDDLVGYLRMFVPEIDVNAIEAAAIPLDFIGVNYYTRAIIEHDPGQLFQFRIVDPHGANTTAMGWEVFPDGLTRVLLRLKDEYHVAAIYVTENGAAFDDPPPQNGVVDDPRRVEYLRAHFRAAADALAQGAPLRGYFVWSLLDNFEWAEGYGKRFGIVHVDFSTLERTPKASAHYLRQVIARNHP